MTVIQILELESNDSQYGTLCHGTASLTNPPKDCSASRGRTGYLVVSLTSEGHRRRRSLCRECATVVSTKTAVPMPTPRP